MKQVTMIMDILVTQLQSKITHLSLLVALDNCSVTKL